MWATACLGIAALGAALWPSTRRSERAWIGRVRRELARRHPDVEWISADFEDVSICCRIRGQETVVPVGALVVALDEDPGSLPTLVAAMVRDERERLDDLAREPWSAVAYRLMPQVRTEAWLSEQGLRFGPTALLHRPLGADLLVCYVVDRGDAMTFVSRQHARAWGRSLDDIDERALANLAERSEDCTVRTGPDREGTAVQRGDGYDAARVLLLDPFHAEGLLLAVPSRDVLWMGGAEKVVDIGALRREVESVAQRAVQPVSRDLYTVRRGRLVAVSAAPPS
ncbi:MAG: DUF1444 family protein [Planctomycetota bacterium]